MPGIPPPGADHAARNWPPGHLAAAGRGAGGRQSPGPDHALPPVGRRSSGIRQDRRAGAAAALLCSGNRHRPAPDSGADPGAAGTSGDAMRGPFLSVVIPCYNAARLLPEAVASVRAQQYEPLEILIVDDGSTDATPQMAPGLAPEVRYFRQENRGPSAARNLGLRQARGELIAPIDADDLWPEGRLDLQVSRLLAEPELDLVSGRVRYVELPGGRIPDLQFEGADRILSGIYIGAAVYRRRAFERVGLYDESMRYGEDHDWFLRAREAGLKMLVLADVTLLYR